MKEGKVLGFQVRRAIKAEDERDAAIARLKEKESSLDRMLVLFKEVQAVADERDLALARLAEIEAGASPVQPSQPYDQQALELCETCGWKAMIPGEPCLMCERDKKQPSQAVELSDKEVRQAAELAAVKVWPNGGHVGWTDEDTMFYGEFSRAIIAAINAKGASYA